MFPDDASDQARIREVSLDGVLYAIIRHNGEDWNLGSTNPLWREELAGLGGNPEPEALLSLEERGIWLSRVTAPAPLAVMCCGLGAAWPGMGRGLYDNFPVAREAMEDLAVLADWDLLGLLWETDQDTINRTRLQIPWLFLLEYAQWRLLRSLGLEPALLCGHSIGELVALCLADVYDTTAAWYLFDTRSRHMENLENIPSVQGGMLAVSANEAEIANVLKEWPELFIANRNTPRQFVLSGPKAPLLAARKSLRKRRIPAFTLNINLAFHNPAMRVLRDLSVRRLNELEMHAPAIPLLSCVTGGLYPSDKPAISEYIADLDENTVDWPPTVQTMLNDFGIGICVELGPRDILCGLVHDLAPALECYPADRIDNEVEAMRQLCARLFSRGYLSFDAILAQKISRGEDFSHREMPSSLDTSKNVPPSDQWGEEGKILLEILAREGGVKCTDIRAGMDLRHDLGLRSSRFPMLAQEVEEKLGRTIELENMFPLVTVADLARLFLGISTGTDKDTLQPDRPLPLFRDVQPLVPYILIDTSPIHLQRTYLNQTMPAMHPGPDTTIMLFGQEGSLLASLCISLAALGCRFAVPATRRDDFDPLRKAGATLLGLECSSTPSPEEFAKAIAIFEKKYGRADGIFIAPPFFASAGNESQLHVSESAQMLHSILACAKYASENNIWLRIFQGWRIVAGKDCHYTEMARLNSIRAASLSPKNIDFRIINWEYGGEDKMPLGAADMLVLELLYGNAQFPLWRAPLQEDASGIFLPSAPCFDDIFPDRQPPMPPRMDTFQGCWQISRHVLPQLASHGHGICENSPGSDDNCQRSGMPWAPLCLCLGAMLKGAELSLPWLKIVSLTNLRMDHAVDVPPGVTRECRIRTRSMAWISFNDVMSRICGINLEVREITGNGRRRDVYAPVCSGECVMTGRETPLRPIWPATPPLHQPENLELIDSFYKLLGLGQSWRIVQTIAPVSPIAGVHNPPEYEARLRLGKCFIAGLPKWGYNNILYMIEGVLHVCALTLAHSHNPDATASILTQISGKWHCTGIGWIRFKETNLAETCELKVEVRQSWHGDDMARFEAQVSSPAGECLLTMYDLEFDKLPE